MIVDALVDCNVRNNRTVTDFFIFYQVKKGQVLDDDTELMLTIAL